MKSTDKKLFPCERFDAERASAQLKHEQDYAQKARLARLKIEQERQQEIEDKAADEAFFWNVLYVLTLIASAVMLLVMIIRIWGK